MSVDNAIQVHLLGLAADSALEPISVRSLAEVTKDWQIRCTGQPVWYVIRFFDSESQLIRELGMRAKYRHPNYCIVVGRSLLQGDEAGNQMASPLARQIREVFRECNSASCCSLLAVSTKPMAGIQDIDDIVSFDPSCDSVDSTLLLKFRHSLNKLTRSMWWKLPLRSRPLTDYDRATGGQIVIREAASEREIRWALRIRYRAYSELGYLTGDDDVRLRRLEFDFFDQYSSHIVAKTDNGRIVATARLVLPGNNPNATLASNEYNSRKHYQQLADRLRLDLAHRSLPRTEPIPVFFTESFRIFYARMGYRVADICELSRVVVHAKFRGLGLSRQLVDAAVSRAANMGRVTMFLECAPHHLRLYEKLGFQLVRGSTGDFHTRDQILDQYAVLMFRDIRPRNPSNFDGLRTPVPISESRAMRTLEVYVQSADASTIENEAINMMARRARQDLSTQTEIEILDRASSATAGVIDKGVAADVGAFITRSMRSDFVSSLITRLSTLLPSDSEFIFRVKDPETNGEYEVIGRNLNPAAMRNMIQIAEAKLAKTNA